MKSRTALIANVVAVVGVIGVLLFGGFLAFQVVQLHGDLSRSQENGQKLYQQLLDEGITPRAQKPSDVVKGDTGAAGPVGEIGPRGFTGLPGLSGLDGTDGKAGTNGKDGASITGPAGPAGQAGADGKDGSNGQPPAGWTFTTSRGNVYTCSRVSPFDPSSPQYACTQTSTAPPTPTPTPTP